MNEERPRGWFRRHFVLPKERATSVEDLRSLLADPPKGFEQRETGPEGKKWHLRAGLDPSGVIPRTILLRAHEDSPVLREVLADTDLVASWPEANREEAERILAGWEEERRWTEEEDEGPGPAEICARLPDRSVPWRERARLLDSGPSEDAEYDMPALAAFFADGSPRLDSDLPELVIEWGLGLVWRLDGLERPGDAGRLLEALRVAVERVPAEGPRIRLGRQLEMMEKDR
jgi:hypothetical protein